MANDEDLARLRQGAAIWNDWRAQNPGRDVDLSGANLSKANLAGADLTGADLTWADLRGADLERANLGAADFNGAGLGAVDLAGANLSKANLAGANLQGADLAGANLGGVDLQGANLTRADLSSANLSSGNLGAANLAAANLGGADLQGANLTRVDLSSANLRKANLSGTNLRKANLGGAYLQGAYLQGANLSSTILIMANLAEADLTGCRVYGISAWDLKLERVKQRDLVITAPGQPEITVDNIEVAQFIYLLLHNEKIRGVIDTITSKVVLILGRFTPDRKAVLDALREELRKRDYLPMLFDFDKPANRDITETVSLLARMARFVIADITEARSIPQELMVIAPDLPSVPIQPLLQAGTGEYGMFEHFRRYLWVLEVHIYTSPQHLVADLGSRVIGPAEAKVRELRG